MSIIVNEINFSIKGEEEFIFNGDRTKEDIVNFAIRMSSPPVQDITRPESMTNLKLNNNLFFVYVGQRDGLLWNAYYSGAIKLQPHGFFYSTNTDIASQHTVVDRLPAIFVYKENAHYFYEGEILNILPYNSYCRLMFR